jgi:uroporphyrinogen decarboxylase
MTPSMTPRERTLAALAFQETDLVPYHIMIEAAVVPLLEDYLDNPGFQSTIVNHLPFYNLEFINTPISPDRYRDDFGCQWLAGEAPHLEVPPLSSASLQNLSLPNLCDDAHFQGALPFLDSHQDHFTFFGIAHGFFERGWCLRGMEEFLMDFIDHPGFVAELFEALTDLYLKVVDRIAEYDFDGIRFGDDWGAQSGMIMGAAYWRKLIKPGLKKIFERARDHDLTVMVHADGDIFEVIPDLIEMGVQILNPIQPETMNIVEIKREYGRHLCLNGGISTQFTLPFGSPQEIRDEVQACLRYLGKGGGFFISPAKAIRPEVPMENAAVLIDAIVHQPGATFAGDLPEQVPELWKVYQKYHPNQTR